MRFPARRFLLFVGFCLLAGLSAWADGDSGNDGKAAASGTAAGLSPELRPLASAAKESFEKGNYVTAEKLYLQILEKDPDNLYTLSNLGVVLFRAGKNKEAEKWLKKATEVAPEDGFSHCTLGIVYYQENMLDEAIQELVKALTINSGNATAHYYLGMAASGKGWDKAASQAFEQAAELDPTYKNSPPEK